MTTTTRSHRSRRRLDVASLILFLVGLAFGALCYWLITSHGANVLIMVPSVVAATVGITHIVKREATRG